MLKTWTQKLHKIFYANFRALKRSGNTGATLVEMVVTFALITGFCTAIVLMITSSLHTAVRITGQVDAQTVSTLLLEKITGELAAADRGSGGSGGAGGAGGGEAAVIAIMDRSAIEPAEVADYLDYATGECISFSDRTGRPVYICVENGYLLIHYREVNGGGVNAKAVDWRFDEDVYCGMTIKSLKFFALLDDEDRHTNLIKVQITVEGSMRGDYVAEQIVECVNLQPSDLSRICNTGIKKDS